jgi:hypothetical protein
VTVIDETNGEVKGNGNKVLEFLQNNRLPESSRHGIEKIEA